MAKKCNGEGVTACRPEERQRLEALRDTQAAAAGSQPAAAKGKPAKPDPKVALL